MSQEILKKLKGIIAQMLKPLKRLPLGLVIEGISGYHVLPFDKNNPQDIEILEILKKAAGDVITEVNKNGILRPRPNEVGNDIEPFVRLSLNKFGYKSDIPATINNKKKSTGYPDIEFIDEFGRYNYIECKTFNIQNIDTTQRSFYLSPSDNFKVTKDAHHFGISFEVYSEKNIKNNHLYKLKSWKILDLTKLKLDVKYEFNADNKRLYNKKLILAEKK